MWVRACGMVSLLVAAAVVTPPATAASIAVPNASFESPVTTFVNTNIDDWVKSAQPVWWDGSSGYDWDQLTGLFVNTARGKSDHIFNIDGNQAIWMFGVPQVELYQNLPDRYTVGQTYALTVGVIGHGGGMLDCITMQVGLYYLDGANNRVQIGSTTVTSGLVDDNGGTHFQDYSFVLPSVRASDPWANKSIGVQLLSISTFAMDPNTGYPEMGGYWDLDNVRLTAVPEPASMALLAIGAGVVAYRRRSRR